MEQTRPLEQSIASLGTAGALPDDRKQTSLYPQAATGTCSNCGGTANGQSAGPPAYVYALGRIEARFPNLALEKEFAQVTGRSDTAGLTDRQALQTILSERSNRYLARQLCWVLTIEGLHTYLL